MADFADQHGIGMSGSMAAMGLGPNPLRQISLAMGAKDPGKIANVPNRSTQ